MDGAASDGAGDTSRRVCAVVHGRVQGVGFRWSTTRRLAELGLAGDATNRPDGTVAVRAQGPPDDVARLLAWLRGGGAPGRVTRVDVDDPDAPAS